MLFCAAPPPRPRSRRTLSHGLVPPFIDQPDIIEKILTHLGLWPHPRLRQEYSFDFNKLFGITHSSRPSLADQSSTKNISNGDQMY